MPNTTRRKYLHPASHEALLQFLDTRSDAFVIINDIGTIMYTNTSACMMAGTTPGALIGTSLWRNASHLVSPTLYQAVHATQQNQKPIEVEYVPPATQTRLHAQLSPIVNGLVLQFHEVSEPIRRPHTVPQPEHLSVDDLNGLYTGIGILTPEGIVLDLNDPPFDDPSLRREQVIGQPLAELPWWSFYPASQHQLRAAITRASQGETVRFETLIHPSKGIDLSFEVTIMPHWDMHHHVEYLIYAGTDITARKRADEAIHTLLDALPQFVWIARPDGSVTYNNQRLIEYLALTLEQVKGNGWMKVAHPEDLPRVRLAWQTAFQTGMPFEAEYRMQDGRSGAYRWFLVRGVPQRNAQGAIIHWVGTCTDIDEQKRIEQQLNESRENLRVLAEAVPQLVWTIQPDGRLEYVNQRYRDWMQPDFEHSGDDFWRQFVHPDDIERTLALRHRSLSTGEPYENEYRLKNSQTGTYHWFLTRGLPVRDKTGHIIKWVGTSTDIDEQKRIEDALRQSQERVRALMDSSIIGIAITEGELVVDANDTALRITGYTRDDLRANRMNWMQMTPPEYQARTLQAQQELETRHAIVPYEKEFVCKDGSRLPVIVGRVTLRTNPSQAIAFVLDNSARKELDQRKDDFINMASHELRNPLTALKMQIQLARRRQQKQSHDEVVTALSRLEQPIKQLERLIGDLLDVSKIQAGKLEYRQERVDLNELLQEIVNTLQHSHRDHTIVVRAPVRASMIGDRDRLGQVFTNLISNAIKYSPQAQTVDVEMEATEEMITVRVRDHGLGIPREQREKIFERFYRVASPRQKGIAGLGMGLYIVARIVKDHGGIITVESEVGKGSTFTVTLPTMGKPDREGSAIYVM